MTRTRTVRLLIVVVACVFAGVWGALVPATALAADPLTVGVPADRCPVFYEDAKTGEVVGIGVDLMRTAAQEAGFEPTFVVVGEQTLKQALDNDAYDLVMPLGSAIGSESGHATVVSENLTQTPFTLVTRGNGDMPPLEELRVGMLRSLGGGAETVQQLYPGVEIAFFETMEESVRALRAGEVDALLHNSYVWSYVLQKPSYADLRVQPSTMFTMDFRAGTLDTPAGRDLIDRLDKGIAKLGDTKRQAIVLDYTSRRLYQYDLADYAYQYGLVVLLCGLLLVAIVVISAQRRRALLVEHEEKMRRLVDCDPLTGVLSLSGFRKRVEELLRANPDVPYLLIYTNVRNFKYINDSLGMEAGDELLRFIAKKAAEMLGPDDALCRIDGDHFAALSRLTGEEKLRGDSESFEDVRNYFVDRGEETRLQICSGAYVLTPQDYQHIDVDHMLDCARVAEKRVRSKHRDGYDFYNPEQWEKGKRTVDVVGHLQTAIKTGELQVWYQPQMDYETGEIVGAEALCRWNHAKLGWLSPGEFIPALEEAGLVFDLDRFVWDKVCQDLRRWKSQGRRLSVSVNLSRSDIQADTNIPEHFLGLVRTYGLDPDQLRIEVTETAYVEEPELLITTTQQLRDMGFEVEMDDFGSGYSSLHMLKEVSVDRIKLDLHFLSGAGDPEKGHIIVSHVIQMVQSLGTKLIAEGVESQDQASFLQSRGCSKMQGYYFYRPMRVEDFERLM